MGCQTDSDGRPGPPFELCQSGSPTDGTALPFLFDEYIIIYVLIKAYPSDKEEYNVTVFAQT